MPKGTLEGNEINTAILTLLIRTQAHVVTNQKAIAKLLSIAKNTDVEAEIKSMREITDEYAAQLTVSIFGSNQ